MRSLNCFCTYSTNDDSYGNLIEKIENLENQTSLQVLWLSDNQIQKLENLENLTSLRQFQCGNNQIRKIGTAFYNNNALSDILLSGNRICSFREILNLVHLPRLTTLSLSDPNFDDNPISSLFNYQTHVILHLPKLLILDSLQITEESRRIIGATVLKKIMYYNMRISTIRRNENILGMALERHYKEKVMNVESDVQILERLSLMIKRYESDAVLTGGEATDTETKQKIARTLAYLATVADDKASTSANMLAQIRGQGDAAIRKLLLELETGGNIRFETGGCNTAWMSSCENVVRKLVDRGVEGKYLKANGSAVRIHRMSLVHNRHLKTTFDEYCNGFGRTPGARYTDEPPSEEEAFEYLLFLPKHGEDLDVFDIVENGFESFYSGGDRLELINYFDTRRESAPGVTRHAIIVKAFVPKMHRVGSKNGLGLRLLTF
jgi:protein phosphatase 1 regulatory subunit 7